DLWEALKDVVDPELGINVVDLGLIYGLHLEDDNTVTIDMTLTSAACPLTDVIEDQTNTALEGLVNGFAINWVWMPPWGLEKITDDGREQLRALGFNVCTCLTRDPAARSSETLDRRRILVAVAEGVEDGAEHRLALVCVHEQ